MLKVEYINIEGIGGISNLSIPFNSRFNIICGPNGVGKTTILDCIGNCFSHGHKQYIRRHVQKDRGTIDLGILFPDGNKYKTNLSKTNFHPGEQDRDLDNIMLKQATNLIVFKTHRQIDYHAIQSITKDQKDQDDQSASSVGIRAANAKNWFINRFIWSAHEDQLTDIQKSNFHTAIELFGMLDDNVKFSRVKVESFDIMVSLNDGSEIYFEYLSSGYKSVIYILLGLMKELEFRFTDNNQMKAADFRGVIIIDELDLHLHPQWQGKLINLLKTVFSNAQFIVSTHSPHMIQTAEPSEILPLGFNENGDVIIREIPSNKYGFQGWTVEEILQDVMGLKETRSQEYIDNMSTFNKALEEENIQLATESFEILNQMIHPNNHLRKLLKLQLAALGSEFDDSDK